MRDVDYSDIIDLSHPISEKHPRMSREARAAQFAPFAALSGYGEAIIEQARRTERRTVLTSDIGANIERWWQLLLIIADAEPTITVKYFLPDGRKEGGSYHTVSGKMTEISRGKRTLTVSGRTLPIGDILSIDSELYRDMIEGE